MCSIVANNSLIIFLCLLSLSPSTQFLQDAAPGINASESHVHCTTFSVYWVLRQFMRVLSRSSDVAHFCIYYFVRLYLCMDLMLRVSIPCPVLFDIVMNKKSFHIQKVDENDSQMGTLSLLEIGLIQFWLEFSFNVNVMEINGEWNKKKYILGKKKNHFLSYYHNASQYHCFLIQFSYKS